MVAEVLSEPIVWSEKTMHDALAQRVSKNPGLHPSGWYDPPADGVSVLFGSSTDPSRLHFDSIRKEKFAASDKRKINDDTVGFVYLSPTDKTTGMIGDFGLTFYRGDNQQVQACLKRALMATEDVVEHAAVGMRFCDLADFAQQTLLRYELKRGEMTLVYDTADVNFGHTIPWSYEGPTPAEQAAIQNSPISKLKDVIARKRLYLSPQETWTIPKTCAFTVEPRVIDVDTSGIHHFGYYHIIVAFQNGKKHVAANFNPLFKALGMDFIRSRF